MRAWLSARRWELWVLVSAVAAHAVLYVGLFALFNVRLGTMEYHDTAVNLAQGRGFVLRSGEPPLLWRPPLYIWFLATIYATAGVSYAAVLVAQTLLNGATTLLVFRLGARLFDRPTALLGAVMTTLHPLIVYDGARLMTESLFTLLLAWTTLAAARLLDNPSCGRAAAAGVATGLGALCRASLQGFPLLLAATTVLVHRGRAPLRGRLLPLAVLLGSAALVIAPWTARNYLVTGGGLIPIDTEGGYALWVGNHLPTGGLDDDGLREGEQFRRLKEDLAVAIGLDPSGQEVRTNTIFETALRDKAVSDRLARLALEEFLQHPRQTALLWPKKLYRFWFLLHNEGNRSLVGYLAALQVAVLSLAAAGLALAVADRRRILAPLLVVGYTLVVHMLTLSNARYSVPILPHLLLLSAYGIRRALGPHAGGLAPTT